MIVREEHNPAEPSDIGKPAAAPFAAIPSDDTARAADRRAAFMMGSLLSMLAIAFFVNAGWIYWKPEASQLNYRIAAGCGGFFLLFRLIIAKFPLSGKLGNPMAAFVSMVAIAYSVLDLNQSANPWATTQILIVLLVAGFMFSSRAWFTLLSVVTCLGWFWAALPHLTDDGWIQMGASLLVAVIWGTWFLEVRLRSLTAFDQKEEETDYARVIEETQFFTRGPRGNVPWCPICKASPNAIIRHDGLKVLDVNLATLRLLQMERNEIEGMPIANVLAPEKRDGLQEILQLGNFEATETVGFKKDQTRFPVEMINGGIASDANATLAMVLHDLSDREKTNERIAAASSRANQLLRRQAELAVLAATPDTAENLDHIMNLIVEAAHRWLPSSLGVFLVLWDNQSQGFVVTASSAQGRLVTDKLAPADDRASIIGWLTTHNESLIVPKLSDDPFGVRVLYPYQSVEAFAAFPVAGTAGVMGFLLVLESETREFPPADVEYLAILTHRATTCCLQVTMQEQLAFTSGGH
jgi:PAS domain S-box-containing protein